MEAQDCPASRTAGSVGCGLMEPSLAECHARPRSRSRRAGRQTRSRGLRLLRGDVRLPVVIPAPRSKPAMVRSASERVPGRATRMWRTSLAAPGLPTRAGFAQTNSRTSTNPSGALGRAGRRPSDEGQRVGNRRSCTAATSAQTVANTTSVSVATTPPDVCLRLASTGLRPEDERLWPGNLHRPPAGGRRSAEHAPTACRDQCRAVQTAGIEDGVRRTHRATPVQLDPLTAPTRRRMRS